MRRREFTAGLGSAAAWPVVVLAQQGQRLRRIGMLMALEEADPEAKAHLYTFTKGLAELGWINGRTARMEVRWAGDSIERACWQPETMCQRCTGNLSMPEMVACLPTDQTLKIYFAAPPAMWMAFFVAQSRPTCRFKYRSNLRWP
jgi:hypothetical protein